MVLPLYFLALVACKGLGAPTTSNLTQTPVSLTQNSTDTNLSPQPTQLNGSLRTVPTCSFSPVSQPHPSNLTNTTFSINGSMAGGPSSTIQVTSPLPLTSPSSPVSALVTSHSTSIVLVTQVATAFETTTIAEPSSTTVVTKTATASTTTPTSPSTSQENYTVWAAPPQMTDLSAFNITSFASGENNYRLVSYIPANDFAPSATSVSGSLPPSSNTTNTTNQSTFLQLVYPAYSANPASKPVGGADFYANPLNLADAHNVTLSYSVLFPADFDWVLGGKLPGLFGGHTGCSGGSPATDCFSTRLMWRPQGAGELYLYAPKDKQTSALCSDPQSVCDMAYGFSIGRGSFNFTAGDWTHVAQTVVLNTPGKNDGTFSLLVNGQPAVCRNDIFYRDVVQQSGGSHPAEFLGLFFSTFFGGHGMQYATPKEQYTWFKDFEIIRHD